MSSLIVAPLGEEIDGLAGQVLTALKEGKSGQPLNVGDVFVPAENALHFVRLALAGAERQDLLPLEVDATLADLVHYGLTLADLVDEGYTVRLDRAA